MIIMYKYTFILSTGQKDHIIGSTFKDVLKEYFQIRGMEIIDDVMIQEIKVQNYPSTKHKSYNINSKLITKIVAAFRQQYPVTKSTERDIQQKLCAEMKQTCPEGSKDVDPIMQYEDWCDDIPYKEFVKNNEHLTQCYRLSNLIHAFKAGLEATKNDAPMPQWPVDPISGIGLPATELEKLYKQAQEAEIEIPELFVKFMNALQSGLFDVDAAVKGQYIGLTDKISEDYRKGFVEPAVEVLFGQPEAKSEQTQEEKDLAMAIQLAEQFGYQ